MLRLAERLHVKALVLVALLGCAVAARAASLDEGALRTYVQRALARVDGRVEVTLGEIDPRRQLAPCTRAEPFVPAGARLWGRSAVGVRCVDGATWTTFVPLEVRVYGPALVAARSLPAGKLVEAEDYRVAEVELTREATGVLTDAADLRDRVVARPVVAGQALRADHVRVRPAVGSGDIVRIVHQGAGFAVSTEGKALGAATAGQTVRVQTDSGRVLSGVATPGRVVQVFVGP